MKNNIKTRIVSLLLAVFTVLTFIPATPAMAAEDYSSGGWNQVRTTCDVTNANGAKIGTVYAGEGVTVLTMGGIYGKAYIEYSASSSAKRGYVPLDCINLLNFYGSCVGRITSSSSTYYAPNTTFRAGSVSSGEYVAVLAESSGWTYIEYNVSGGSRKRAFIPTSCVSRYSSVRNTFYHVGENPTSFNVTHYMTVYAGPNPGTYPEIGSINSNDNGAVYYYMTFANTNGHYMAYISYPTSSGTKYGYIDLWA